MKSKFGGLGGFLKDLNGLMPDEQGASSQDRSAKRSLKALEANQEELFARIGRQVVEQNGPDGFGALSDELKAVQQEIRAAEASLQATSAPPQNAGAQGVPCPNCGTQNAPGVNFCQGCGTKLARDGVACPQCGLQSQEGTKFCMQCGTKLPG